MLLIAHWRCWHGISSNQHAFSMVSFQIWNHPLQQNLSATKNPLELFNHVFECYAKSWQCQCFSFCVLQWYSQIVSLQSTIPSLTHGLFNYVTVHTKKKYVPNFSNISKTNVTKQWIQSYNSPLRNSSLAFYVFDFQTSGQGCLENHSLIHYYIHIMWCHPNLC